MTSLPASDRVYLASYLAPLRGILDRLDVTDVYVNRPREIWAETLGGEIERHDAPELDEATLARLTRQIAALSHQGISREHPLLSATLPGGERVQLVVPPATRGEVALAIRKHVSQDLSLEDYAKAGALDQASLAESDSILSELGGVPVSGLDLARLLRDAVRTRKNILISGGTSTGKTTFLNALLREVPPQERLLFIEDTPELQIRHANAVGLLAVRSELGEARVGANDLVAASLRMRPDRIILGELRGTEAFAFLRAINTGHPGSMTTIHADSTVQAVEQLVLLVLQAGTRLNRGDIVQYIETTIDLYVQLARSAGRRYVAEVRAR